MAIQVPAAVTVVVTNGVSSISTWMADPGAPVPFTSSVAVTPLSCTVTSLTVSTGSSSVAAATSDAPAVTVVLWSPLTTGEGVGANTRASSVAGGGVRGADDRGVCVGVGASAICPGPSSTGVMSRIIMTRPPNSAERPAFTSYTAPCASTHALPAKAVTSARAGESTSIWISLF